MTVAQVEELERLGKRYLKCSECDYGAFDEAYVRAHVDGVVHRDPLPPGAERGPEWLAEQAAAQEAAGGVTEPAPSIAAPTTSRRSSRRHRKAQES